MTTMYKPNTENLNFHEKIQKELSSYIEKAINENGSVAERVVENSYFLMNDTWNINFIGSIENFKEQYDNHRCNYKNLRFFTNNPSVNLEFKYMFYNKLFKDEWSITTIYTDKARFLSRLIEFLNEKYPNLSSLLDLNVEETERKWVLWLENKKLKTMTTTKSPYGQYTHKTKIANFLRVILSTLVELVDIREEWEKDRWDVRLLSKSYGIHFNHSDTHYYIDFSGIKNIKIRIEVKEYLKQRLISKQNFSWGQARNYITVLPNFIEFILSIEPSWNDLKGLTRKHMENYIEWLHKYTKVNVKRKNSNPERYISVTLTWIQHFLEDIQRYRYNMAPKENIRVLIFPGDKPRQKKKAYDQIDYIPDYVLEQLFENIQYLSPEVQSIVWIAFKTGLRISDVLGLTQDCLVKLNAKYQVVTDIEKTYVQGHSIPIDDELASMIAVLIDNSVQKSNQDNNPEKYIFIHYRGSRKGRPYSQTWIQRNLNSLARERNITDENGKVFYFKPHQFRHTYAIKMLNGGADILTVQELLAHASPEMTMRYARLLDDTKRKAFETAVKQGVFSFDLNGKVYDITETEEIPQDIVEMLWRDHKLTAIDNPYGSCRARLNGDCPYAEEPPCLTCNGGKPCKDLAVGLSDMDVAKYEIHIQSTSKMIEIAKQYGREEIIEKNQKNLERLQDIYNTIKQGNIIFGRLERIKRKQGVSSG